MNRTEYYRLRHAARLAARAWWNATKNPYATPFDRDSARLWMEQTCSRVPGGMAHDEGVISLPGWYSRRYIVNGRIRERKSLENRERVLGLMSDYCRRNVP